MKKKRSLPSPLTPRIRWLKISCKLLVYLFSIFFCIEIIPLKIADAQNIIKPSIVPRDNLDYEMWELLRQLGDLENKIIPIDNEFNALKEKHESIIGEITQLKQQLRENKGFWSRITGVFSERRLRNLLAESQDLSDRITELQKTREPLIRNLITLANRLIDRGEVRIISLMDIIIKNESGADRASEQISSILILIRKVSYLRDKYSPNPSDQSKATPLLSLTNEPAKLRLGAKFAKNMAIQYRSEAEKKKREIKDLQAKQKRNEIMIEKWREIQRSNEEKESSGIEGGTANIPSSFNENEIKKTIESIKKDIERLQVSVHELEEDAKNLDNQSRMLEQRATQIESTSKGK